MLPATLRDHILFASRCFILLDKASWELRELPCGPPKVSLTVKSGENPLIFRALPSPCC
jgi:hypothetical protein